SGTKRASPDPHHLAHRDQLVEQPRIVAGDPAGDDVAFDDRRRQRRALQLEDDLQQAIDATRAGANAVPGGKETSECVGWNRLDLAPQRGQRTPPEHAQYLRVAVLSSP